MNNYIVVRNKPDKNGKINTQITKKDKVDLTEYKMVQVRDNGMEEYVHLDEYEIYKKIYDNMGKKE